MVFDIRKCAYLRWQSHSSRHHFLLSSMESALSGTGIGFYLQLVWAFVSWGETAKEAKKQKPLTDATVNFSIVQATNISLVYTIDSYRPVTGELAVTQHAFKCKPYQNNNDTRDMILTLSLRHSSGIWLSLFLLHESLDQRIWLC